MSFDDKINLRRFQQVFSVQKASEFMAVCIFMKFTAIYILLQEFKTFDQLLILDNINAIFMVYFIAPKFLLSLLYAITAYPIGVYVILHFIRSAYPKKFGKHFPEISSAVTILYALIWIHIFNFDFNIYTAEYPLILTITASAFVYFSTRLIDRRMKL